MPARKHDHRVEEILGLLGQGKTREEAARELGYKGYKSLHIKMTRHGFRWDRNAGRYLPVCKEKALTCPCPRQEPLGRAARIIELIGQGIGAKKAAQTLRFSDHREMAAYMAGKGYRWDPVQSNYFVRAKENIAEEKSGEQCLESAETDYTGSNNAGLFPNATRYLPLLEWLTAKQDKLEELLSGQDDSYNIPRFVIPGGFITKGVHMSQRLDQMVRDFSQEKKVSQREIFEVALVDFFRKYGYRREIDAMLKMTY
ncbi:hypothetical protein DCCM_4460 [Desulfocucumis palustris]|uniref:Uncharacterized protein n=1 Tax=Desulfocucumis palustris TaxID=1898651 RepID=A0A2L2XG77_9FIRM|nr:hypothetical protein [Desulfocucumis palustris]GBF35337.1 hypothetical protein DCCM_4460 [Desulfocucumis palustris]